MKENNKKGFSLLEVLLVIGIIFLIAGISTPLYQSFQTRNDLGLATFSVANSLYRAQTLARAVFEDSNWGVYATTGNIIIFKGLNYGSRDSIFDEENNISDTISISGISEFVFDKLTGYPTTTGSILLTAINNATSSVSINSKGMIEY